MTSARADWIGALHRLLEVTALLTDDMNRDLAERGLSTSLVHLVWELHQRGPVTQRTLADALAVSPRHITGLVDALTERGFVIRRPHPADRRATLVTLTELGSATTGQMARDQEEFARLLFADLREDRFSCLVAGLDDVLTRLRAAVRGQVETR